MVSTMQVLDTCLDHVFGHLLSGRMGVEEYSVLKSGDSENWTIVAELMVGVLIINLDTERNQVHYIC